MTHSCWKTLHGQFINKYFKNNIDALDMLIEEALHKKKYPSEQVNFEIKPEGKKGHDILLEA